jgi:D,D-heptose 1,7-bisphosphate phosphatase
MVKAVFLDRDGIINREVDVLRSKKQLRLLPKVAEALQELHRLGFLTIIITNQAVVARGWQTEKDVEEIHNLIQARLSKKGAQISAFYYCPHHPEANLVKYRKRCRCRKPNTGLIRRAMKDFNINAKKSFMIGDRTGDILAGRRANLKTILVKSGYGGADGQYKVKPDFIAASLREAVKIIKNVEQSG